MADPDDILARVTVVIVQSLGVDEDGITPSATLIGDLGAESIDFLDIVFRLEREFGIKVPHGELFTEPAFLGGPGYVRDGRLTPEGLAALRTQMPYADLSGLERDGRPDRVTELFTVGLLVRYVTWKLDRGRDTATDAGATVLAPPRPGGRSSIA